jgi:predicted esterase YcpF (UPF0227 family)
MTGELTKINGKKVLICCFGGMAKKMGGILPFEFLNYLTLNYKDMCDLIFYIDDKQCCYHKGIHGISTNIEETIQYINKKIIKGDYEKIIFMGVSAGGYASILLGSLCKNITYVISFIPKVILNNPHNKKYKNLKTFINTKTQYILIGDESIKDINDSHHIRQCEELKDFNNVTIIRKEKVVLKELRDNGTIKSILDTIIFQ